MTQTLGCNHAVGKSVQVTAGDSELFTYVYRPTDPQLESPRPYLHPPGRSPRASFRPRNTSARPRRRAAQGISCASSPRLTRRATSSRRTAAPPS